MTDPEYSSGTAEAVAYCGWHPEHGYALQTCGHDQQHAASLLMRTDLAGNHGWSVQPLYAALSPTPQTAGGVRKRAESSIKCLRAPDPALKAVPNTVRQALAEVIEQLLAVLSPQAQAGETYSGQTATNLGATIEVVGTISGVAQRQPGLHAWRFIKDNGQWSQWMVLPDAQSVTDFKDLMGHNLDRGTHQLQSFFAAGPSLPSTEGKRRD